MYYSGGTNLPTQKLRHIFDFYQAGLYSNYTTMGKTALQACKTIHASFILSSAPDARVKRRAPNIHSSQLLSMTFCNCKRTCHYIAILIIVHISSHQCPLLSRCHSNNREIFQIFRMSVSGATRPVCFIDNISVHGQV